MSAPRALNAFIAFASLALVACAERANPPPPEASGNSSAAPSSSGSEPGARTGAARGYDPAAVETIRGQVVRVEQVAQVPGRAGGVHVLMNTEAGAITVHLGPAWFIEEQRLTLEPGDTLEVTGSRLMIDGAPALVARSIVKGQEELVLRNAAGIPRWSAGRRVAVPPVANEPEGSKAGMAVLSDAEEQALRDALDDEYRAMATYDQVISDFGAEIPFVNIREAEARHIEALHNLFERYRMEIPENTWPGRVPRFSSMHEACMTAVQDEIENVALYDRLMESTKRADLLAVFRNLQSASQEKHIPAFRRCSSRQMRPGAGRG